MAIKLEISTTVKWPGKTVRRGQPLRKTGVHETGDHELIDKINQWVSRTSLMETEAIYIKKLSLFLIYKSTKIAPTPIYSVNIRNSKI